MFSKKPAQPKAPWAIRVLTPDYLIDGALDSDEHPESWPFFSPEADVSSGGMLYLASPRFTPVSPNAGAPPTVSQWLLPGDGLYAAVMPLDEAGLAALRKSVSSFKHTFAAVLHAGPYAIWGQLLSNFESAGDLYNLARHRNLAVQDATIEHRQPGAAFAGLKAPLVMVSMRQLLGIGLVK